MWASERHTPRATRRIARVWMDGQATGVGHVTTKLHSCWRGLTYNECPIMSITLPVIILRFGLMSGWTLSFVNFSWSLQLLIEPWVRKLPWTMLNFNLKLGNANGIIPRKDACKILQRCPQNLPCPFPSFFLVPLPMDIRVVPSSSFDGTPSPRWKLKIQGFPSGSFQIHAQHFDSESSMILTYADKGMYLFVQN